MTVGNILQNTKEMMILKKIPEIIYGYDEVSFTGKNKIGKETITYKKSFDDGTIMYIEEIRNKRNTLTINTLYKYKKLATLGLLLITTTL